MKVDWIKIADDVQEFDFPTNNIIEIYAGDKRICLAKHEDQLFAFQQKCPHAGGFLSDGHMDPLGNVVCPLHRYKFSIKNGRNTTGEGYYLKRWPVEVREDGVYVGLESNKLFGLF